MVYVVQVFFFKQKTAYEMRISDWSSDVCSSDLTLIVAPMQHRQDLVLIDALERDHVDLDRQPGRPRRRQPLQHRPDVAVPRYMRETFGVQAVQADIDAPEDRKSTRLNSSH